MGIYDMYQGYIDPNQQKLALAQALFAAAAGMNPGYSKTPQNTIGNISAGLAQGTGMYQQSMNNALQQSFATRRIKEMQEEEEFQKRIKTGLETPITETKTVTKPFAPEEMPQYDPGTLTPDMYQQSVTQNMSRMPGPGDYMDIYSKAAMESARPDRIKEAIALQTAQEDRSYNRGAQFFNAVKQYVKDPNKQAELINNSPYAKTLGFNVSAEDMGQGLIPLRLDDGTTVRVEPDKALNYLRLKEDSAARREMQQEMKDQRERFHQDNMDMKQMIAGNAYDKAIVTKTMIELPKLKKEAISGANHLQQTKTALDLIDKGVTGKGGQVKAFLAPYAEALGVNTQNLTDAQTYQLLTRAIVGPMRLEIVGPGPVSEWEQKLMQQISGGGGAAKGAAKQLIGYYRSLAEARVKNYNDTVEGITQIAPNIGMVYQPISGDNTPGGRQKASPPPGYTRKFYSPSTGKTKYIYPDGREVIQ